jgi:hypothetical protein
MWGVPEAEYTLSCKYGSTKSKSMTARSKPNFSLGHLLSCYHGQGKVKQERNKQSTKRQKEERQKFKEPKIKWNKSKARELFYEDIQQGQVPLDSKDDEGKKMMPLPDIYSMRPKFAEHADEKILHASAPLEK